MALASASFYLEFPIYIFSKCVEGMMLQIFSFSDLKISSNIANHYSHISLIIKKWFKKNHFVFQSEAINCLLIVFNWNFLNVILHLRSSKDLATFENWINIFWHLIYKSEIFPLYIVFLVRLRSSKCFCLVSIFDFFIFVNFILINICFLLANEFFYQAVTIVGSLLLSILREK